MRLSRLYLALIALCSCLMLGSCHRRSTLAEEMDPQDKDAQWIMVHIGAIGSGREAADVEEKIKSLRIIMIQDDGKSKYIEANRLIDAENAAASFRYIFQKRTAPGKKRFYLIANEECVHSVSFSGDGVSMPAGMKQNPTLTAFLNYFDPDMPVEGDDAAPERDYTAAEFEKMLQSLCFDAMEAYDKAVSNRVVYLPYSAYYDFEVKATDGYEVDYTNRPMYLVPVATKFSFKFINERTKDDVAIDYLAIEKLNQSTYLMAKLEDWEQKKSISNKEYYWIDWLKFVADQTAEAIDQDTNLGINGTYGWISGYFVPNSDDAEVHYIVPDGDADSPSTPTKKSTSWILPKAKENDGDRVESTTTEFGPFYLPESHYMVDKEVEDASGKTSNQTVESYTLKLKMRNAASNVDSESLVEVKKAETEISNVKSMFRNTSVLITITLREGGVNIYAESVPWTKKTFYGYIKDEDEIK